MDREFSAVSITNPHLVVFVDEINVAEVEEVGKKANSDKEVLPKGVNVNFVKIMDEDSIYVKTYERGVGLTKVLWYRDGFSLNYNGKKNHDSKRKRT